MKMNVFISIIFLTVSFYWPTSFSMEMDFGEYLEKKRKERGQTEEDYFQIGTLSKTEIQRKYKELSSRLPDRTKWRYIQIKNKTDQMIQIIYKKPCPGFEGPHIIKTEDITVWPNKNTGKILIHNKYKIKIFQNNVKEVTFYAKENGEYCVKKDGNTFFVT